MAYFTDPDQILNFAASDLGLHSILRLACMNAYNKYGTWFLYNSREAECSDKTFFA